MVVHVLQEPVDTRSYLPTPDGAIYDLLQSFHMEYLSSFSNYQADKFFVDLVLPREGIAIGCIINMHALEGEDVLINSLT